ncbi:MAG: polyprenyl diphosphate synthase [Patescibacteria group bacterium UBA2103]
MKNSLSVGIIMDGNRRWAKAHNVSAAEGHKKGSDALIDLLRAYPELKESHNITDYIFYAFSTENWNRSEEEVGALMNLLKTGLSRIEEELEKLEEAPRIRFIGDLSRFEESLQKEMKDIEMRTKDGEGVVALALSYGGRDEIVRAAQKAETISEEGISENLDTHDIKDPDIIIRTGGEKRLSNFLLWQAAYSEFFFIDIFWPEFTRDTLISCITEYNERERRHGV